MDKQQIVENLLYPVWVAIPKKFKDSQKSNTWNILGNWIGIAASKNSLALFYDVLNKKLNLELRPEHLKGIESVLNAGNDAEMLRFIREEKELLSIMTRLHNQTVKSEYAANK